jgi:hypothetical protein
MSTSTDGQICFGVLIGDEDEVSLPWKDEEWDGDIEHWWIYKVLGFKHSFEVFDEKGDYLPGFNKDSKEIDQYFKEKREFKKNCLQCPVEPVNCCSLDYPSWILAVPSTVITASRGEPQEFKPENLRVTIDEVSNLLKFCSDYEIEFEGDPHWYLSSYWG